MTAKTSVADRPHPEVDKIKLLKGASGRLDLFFAFNPKSIITSVLCAHVHGAHFLVSTNLQGKSLEDQCMLSREKRV